MQTYQVPLEILNEDIFRGVRGIRYLYRAMKVLYDILNEIKEQPLIKKIHALKTEREEKIRTLHYLEHIVSVGIQS